MTNNDSVSQILLNLFQNPQILQALKQDQQKASGQVAQNLSDVKMHDINNTLNTVNNNINPIEKLIHQVNNEIGSGPQTNIA